MRHNKMLLRHNGTLPSQRLRHTWKANTTDGVMAHPCFVLGQGRQVGVQGRGRRGAAQVLALHPLGDPLGRPRRRVSLSEYADAAHTPALKPMRALLMAL